MTDKPQFFLKTALFEAEPQAPYTNLCLRHYGSGTDSVVPTESPPKFIKGHLDGKQIKFTSASHEGRQWGLTLRADGEQRAGWENVDIVENGGSDGLVFVTRGSEEVLEFDETDDAGELIWRGWMVCEWAQGYPQLFWVTDRLKGELPAFCHRVRIVREML